jgi:hypothetical protein
MKTDAASLFSKLTTLKTAADNDIDDGYTNPDTSAKSTALLKEEKRASN